MNFITVMRETLELDEKQINRYLDDLNYIDQFLKKHDIEIPSWICAQFCNHIIMLLQRLENDECAQIEYYDESEDMIDDKFKELAIDFLKPLFNKYHIKIKEEEILLIAIYFQAFTS